MPVITILSNLPKITGIKPVVEKIDALTSAVKDNKQGISEFSDAIETKDLSFSYDQEKTILNSVNQRFEKGKKYAILGKSGCGKTTLTKVM